MSSLIEQVAAKALALGVPLSVQLDLTWRCNLRCLHCYLEHDGSAELPADAFAEILDQLAGASGPSPCSRPISASTRTGARCTTA